jgi:hypothetical protein
MVSSEWIDKQVYHTGGIKRNTKEIIGTHDDMDLSQNNQIV